jgi:hypothetical protein
LLRSRLGSSAASALSCMRLRAVAEHAAVRVALYPRRTYPGRGEPQRLTELERIAKCTADRLRRAQRVD